MWMQCFSLLLTSAQVVEQFEGPYLTLEGNKHRLLNMATFDFLGLEQRKELKEAAVQALDKVISASHPHLVLFLGCHRPMLPAFALPWWRSHKENAVPSRHGAAQ